jgi:hypothetical protein
MTPGKIACFWGTALLLCAGSSACASPGGVAPAADAAAMPAMRPAASAPGAPRRWLFPPTPGGVHLNLVFNYAVPHLRSELGVVDVVWGSRSPKPLQVFNQYYTPFERDGQAAGRHTLAWFKHNHPDWIEYLCDRKVAFEFRERYDVPLDIANPAVLQYQRSTFVEPAFAAGYRSVDFDNLSLGNYSRRCGHYTTSGAWVAQYSGKWDDPQYLHDVLAWASGTYAYVHAYSPSATMAINYSYQTGFGFATNRALMTDADEVLDEGGFTSYGMRGYNVTTGKQWARIVRSIRMLQANGTCYMENGEEPGLSSRISQAERLWVVGNYLLTRDDCTYVWISGYTASGAQDYGRILLYPEYALPIGAPTGAARAAGGGWTRPYTHGLVLVNPSARAVTFALQGTYKDENGASYAGSIVLPSGAGQILLAK